MCSGFPRDVEKVLNCEIGFQDLGKVLNLAKVYIKYWRSMEIPHSAMCLFKFCSLPLMTVLQMFFCIVFHESNFPKMGISDDIKVLWFSIEEVLKSMESVFENAWEPWVFICVHWWGLQGFSVCHVPPYWSIKQ